MIDFMKIKALNSLLTIIIITTLSLPLSSCVPVAITAAAGTSIAVAKDRSLGNTVDDIAIATKIRAEFINHGFSKMFARISVQVMQGRVLYTGTVRNNQDAVTAVSIAWNQTGVKEVINELKVDSSNSFDLSKYLKDSWITSQIKTKMVLDHDIKSINYTVITYNDVVYLFGIARSKNELNKVSNIASTIKSVKKVISYVKIIGK